MVAGKGMHQGAFNWINRQLNLWNVAVTRARSHLVVVGDRDRWTRSGGVGAALAQAADDEAAGRPTTTADQELHQRLFTTLNQHTHAKVELATMRHGHPVDAVVHINDAATAVLLDPGPAAQDDPDRHLRVKRRQQSLVDDGNTAPAIRMPAWRLY